MATVAPRSRTDHPVSSGMRGLQGPRHPGEQMSGQNLPPAVIRLVRPVAPRILVAAP